MTDLIGDALNWLANQQKAHTSQSVTYRRDGDAVVVAATIGRTEHEVALESGAVEKLESRDYLIQAADLILGGVTTLPQRGDRIEETQGTKTYVYEALPFGSNQDHWRYADAYRITLRIHTRLIDEL